MSEIVDDRAVIVSADGVDIITLNPVGTIVWSLLDVARDRAAVVDGLAAEFPEHDRTELENDVTEFLTELMSGGLVDAEG